MLRNEKNKYFVLKYHVFSWVWIKKLFFFRILQQIFYKNLTYTENLDITANYGWEGGGEGGPKNKCLHIRQSPKSNNYSLLGRSPKTNLLASLLSKSGILSPGFPRFLRTLNQLHNKNKKEKSWYWTIFQLIEVANCLKFRASDSYSIHNHIPYN